MIKKFTQSFSSGASLNLTRWLAALALPLVFAQAVQAQLNYVAVACSDPYVQAQGQAGTTFIGQGDDATFTNLALPFPFSFYGTNYTQYLVNTNGHMVFLAGAARGFTNANLPTATAGAALYPFWDDLDINQATAPNAGIYTRVDGVAPNRIFTVEWFNAGHFPDAANQTITFQVRLFENGNRIQFKYLDVIFGGGQAAFDNGASATVGLEGPLPAPRPFTLYSFNTASLTNGQCIEFVLPQACNPIAGGTVSANTAPGTCQGTATVALPSFNPAGCLDGVNTGLRYSLNGGAFVNVPFPLPATIVLNNLPKGANVLVWQTYLLSNGATSGSATQTINVVDNEPPVLSCPANVILNLSPGACAINYSYTVSVTDNCPFITGPFTLNTTNVGGNANSVGGMVWFNLNNTSGQDIIVTAIGLNISAATTVNIYRKAGTHVGFETNPGAWTLVGSANANTGPFSGPFPGNGTITQAPINAPGSIVFPPGLWGIALHTLTAQSNYTNGNGLNQTYTDPNITLNLGSTANTPWGAPFTPRVFNGSITYQIGGSAEIVQTQGLPSGAEFPLGTTTNCFEVTDAAGNPATCCFTVTVNPYPNPILSLACNDLVQVSVDENCSAVIGADQVLEGGPYGCYDNYIVELDRTPPYGNGPWTPAVVGPGDIGKTYQFRVTDPNTGNRCWGNIKIEDKLPPVLDCVGGSIPCNADPSPGQTGTVAGPPVQLNTINAPNNGNSSGGMAWFNIENLSGGDIQIIGLGLNISNATNVDIYAKAGTHVGFETNPGAWTLVGTATANTGPFAGPVIGAPVITPATLNAPGSITVPPGLWGVAIHTPAAAQSYTNGTGANQTFTDGTVTITLGSTANTPWGAPFTPRVWNGYIVYMTAGTAGPGFPNGLTLNENIFSVGNGCYNVTIGAGDPVLEPCSNASLCYLDTEVTQNCASGLTKIINRKWTATDASGNTATCIQVIEVLRPTLNSVQYPPSYDDIDEPALSCGGTFPTPDYLEGIGLQGYPYVFGQPDGCSIGWTYEDAIIGVCDGTYKIRRKWVVVDWCTGDDEEYNQIIKVLDDEGPTFTCPANITVGTDPFTCCATVDLPNFIATDNCSRITNISAMVTTFDPQTNQQLNMYTVGGTLTDFPGNNYWDRDTMVNVGLTPCLPIGTHTVVYTLSDQCGNTTTCSFRVTVRDLTPPVAACDEFTIVGIGVDDPFDCYEPADSCNFAGVTWVKATTFDDGSYDNCGDIKFTIRRMAPYSDCILALNPINGHPICDPQIDPFPDFPSEFERGIGTFQQYDPNWFYEGADSIKFYCCEVGTTQTIILAVYQLDVNGQPIAGPDGQLVRNECMIQVEVQDKLKPICQGPANVSVSCENFDPSLWAYGIPAVYDNCCLDETQSYQGQCGLTHSVNYGLFDTVCNKGTITRTFRVFDCHGQSNQCTQRIFVNYEQDYWLKFPNDVIVSVCDGTGNYGEPEFFGEDCELLGVSFEDEIFTVVPDACYKIERTWTVINWCTYNPNLGCINVPNPNPNPAVNHPSNLTGVTVSPAGTPQPWNPTVVAIAPGQTPTNYSTFWDANANCYKYKQIIKVIDNQAPVVDDCPASPVEVNDLTANDPLFWNQMYWWDNTIESHDLCEAPTDLCITATDLCSGSNISIRYLLFLDLDGDGTMETVINSVNTGLAGLGWNAVPYGNGNNPNYTGGTIRQFDNRPVLPNQKYGFAIQTTVSGNDKTACVRWNTQQSQNTYVVPELPYGTHKIKWFVSDGCGNEAVCEYTFIVKDGKKPTVVCINGLSVNIMPTKMVSLWDTDFLQYTEDNCTPSNRLVTAIRKSGQGTGFPLNPDGTPQKSVTFTCDELGTQLVELWSRDLAGNADYCETYVIVQDNMNNCSNTSATVAGALKTEANKGLEDATVALTGSHPALPPAGMFDVTDAQGNYTLGGIPLQGDYTVTPGKDNDPLNGVSTFDLVLINKHILGLEPLNTPYKMIAADANNSRSITTFDIVELRKLILGIYTELPNNTSWRFVDKSYTFPNANNPFQTIFPETKQIAQMLQSMDDEDFVSVKVGDVNGNAVTSSLTQVDDRTAGTLLFDVEDRAVKAGETFTVNFKAAEKVQGYQFTLNYNNLELLDVVPGANMKLDNFGVFQSERAVTTSFDGDVQGEFALTFRATANGTLSQLLGVSSRITKSEAYNAGNERLEVAFRFNGATGSTIAGLGFELYQNQPNPFINKTQIGFYLPEAATATLTIFNEAGQMVFTQKGDYAKGYNAVTIDRAVLNTTGVLYYKLETATNSATKKMIQTK